MIFVQAVRSYYRNYANFDGRTARTEFWLAWIWQLLVFGLALMGSFVIAELGPAESEPAGPAWNILALVVIALLFGHVLPSLAINVRRLHDSGLGGWTYLVVIIPLVGPLVLFALLLRPSEFGPNTWGPEPERHYSTG